MSLTYGIQHTLELLKICIFYGTKTRFFRPKHQRREWAPVPFWYYLCLNRFHLVPDFGVFDVTAVFFRSECAGSEEWPHTDYVQSTWPSRVPLSSTTQTLHSTNYPSHINQNSGPVLGSEYEWGQVDRVSYWQNSQSAQYCSDRTSVHNPQQGLPTKSPAWARILVSPSQPP